LCLCARFAASHRDYYGISLDRSGASGKNERIDGVEMRICSRRPTSNVVPGESQMERNSYFRRSAVISALSQAFGWSRSTAVRNASGLLVRTVGRTAFFSEASIRSKFGDEPLRRLHDDAEAIELPADELPPSLIGTLGPHEHGAA
jgi:hypothetical protein